MTENFTREQWDRHEGDTLPKDTLDKAFNKVMTRARATETADSKAVGSSRSHRVLRISSMAAAACAVLVAVPWLTLKIHSHIESDGISATAAGAKISLCEVSTRNGEIRELLLPDGSTVSLNAGSVIIYPEKFSDFERQVYLSGEAVFSVVHSDSAPFTVSTSDLEVMVHGTVFNVDAYPESPTAAATLCEGSISARVKGVDEEMTLVPNQRLSLQRESGEVSVSHVNASEDTAWLRGDMCFRSENIHSIVRQIERKYGINVYVTSGKYDSMRLTAKFVHGESLPKMLRSICKLVPGMSYEIKNGCVYIR